MVVDLKPIKRYNTILIDIVPKNGATVKIFNIKKIHALFITFLFLSLPVVAKANPLEGVIPTDKAAHFGVAYAAQIITYGAIKNQLKLDQVDSAILSTLGVFAAGVLWETLGSTRMDKGDIFANSVGQALAVTTIFTFDF